MKKALVLCAVLAAPLLASAESGDAGNLLVASTTARPASVRNDSSAQVLAVFGEYERAYAAQDLTRLKGVWDMGPVEELLVQKTWNGCRTTSTQVQPGPVSLFPGAARVRFEQEIRLHCANGPVARRESLEATLHKSANGRWTIETLTPQGDLTSLLARSATTPDERAPLELLDRYAAALEACDTARLADLWISNRTERARLRGVCGREQRPDVALSDPHVTLRGDQATVEFRQDLAFAANDTEHSALRALLVRRSGGEWSIWKLKEAGAP